MLDTISLLAVIGLVGIVIILGTWTVVTMMILLGRPKRQAQRESWERVTGGARRRGEEE